MHRLCNLDVLWLAEYFLIMSQLPYNEFVLGFIRPLTSQRLEVMNFWCSGEAVSKASGHSHTFSLFSLRSMSLDSFGPSRGADFHMSTMFHEQ